MVTEISTAEVIEKYFKDERCVGRWVSEHQNLMNGHCFDYLRLIGILLPFTYLDENNKPVTLTPEQIINMGWCKITTK